ncbi:MAG: LysR family transcriptional regulator [Alphaproteobacteria bacterium]|nr:LysR family transcriptional regulator [Alphaproteobacteria bacterium]
MEMHQVRYFLAVSRHLNFTRVAEECHVSQPALTRAIKKLEDELGGLLFRRERNQTHATDLGRMMQPHLQRFLEASKLARAEAQGLQNLELAPLALGLMCTVGPARLIGLVKELRREVPTLTLSLSEDTLENLLERMIAGDLEVAVLATPEPLPDRLDFTLVYRERYVIAFPPRHRFESMPVVKIRDVNDELYLKRMNCEYSDYLADLLETNGSHLRICYRSEREDWIQSMVMAGMGCAFMPE